MHSRLILALFVSIFLVGGALWTRLSSQAVVRYELTAVRSDSFGESNLVQDTLSNNFETTVLADQYIPKTDVLGRGLISDYVNLATSGQVSEEKIKAIANRYIESIPAFIQSETIKHEALKIVPDTQDNLQKYANDVTAIHSTYAKAITTKSPGINLNVPSSDLYSFILVFSRAYKEAADKLKNISVPSSLAQTHLRLINSYLESAEATQSVSKMENDPAIGFAGLVVFNENLDIEEVLLAELAEILTLHGI